MKALDKITVLYRLAMLRLSYIVGPVLRAVGLGHAIYRKECWGNDYPDKTFLVLRRGDNCGLCSYFTTMIGGVKYALKHGYIPVVDMQTQKNIYLTDDQVGKVNAWEWYFKQPGGYSLSDIAHAKNVIIALHWRWRGTPSMKMGYLRNRWGLLAKDRDFVIRYFRMQKHVLRSIDQWASILMIGKDTLGVFLRGTDYARMKPFAHPRQPGVDKVIEDVRQFLEETLAKQVYLVTEDKTIRLAFVQAFSKRLKYIPQEEANYDGGYIGDYAAQESQSGFLKKGEDYLVAISLLSRCGSVVASRANGSLVARLFSIESTKFDFYDLGTYGLFDSEKPAI